MQFFSLEYARAFGAGIFCCYDACMFWADQHARRIAERTPHTAGTYLIRDEKTASGRVHIGSMRGVAVHGLVTDVLKADGTSAEFVYEINDFDPMDGIPAELDAAVWGEYLGRPLKDIPAPGEGASNFAEYYAQEFQNVIHEAGFTPRYYRSSELYLSGKMNEVITQAIEGAALIRRIYKEISGSEKKEDWIPVSVVCEQCGKVGTTQAYAWDGNLLSYRCTKGPGGAEGCGHDGARSPYNGGAKLPWKVEWPAKWKVVGVDVEGAGKDHSTKGGAREVAEAIAREVFGVEPPYDMPYEFFLDSEGKKMSSSKGRGVSSREIADNFPPTLLRLALIGKDPLVQTSIDPHGEMLALLYDWHDRIAEKYWDGVGDDDARLFTLLYHSTPPERHYLPRFSVVVFVAQMKHVSPETEFAALKGAPLSLEEKHMLDERVAYAHTWLRTYAPEKYKYILQDTLPEKAAILSVAQRDAVRAVATAIAQGETYDGPTLHAELHAVKERLGIPPKELFSALYIIFLGRDSGPQAGWFLSTLDRDFVLKRLREASEE